MTDVRRLEALFALVAGAGFLLVGTCGALLLDLALDPHPTAGGLGSAGALAVAAALGALPALVLARAAVFAARLLRAGRAAPVVARDVLLDGVAVSITPGEGPQAYCAGLLRPRIVISEMTVASLDACALHAVLAHEAHHARRRDALRLLVARLSCEALVFLPVLRRLRERLETSIELQADRAAVRDQGDVTALAAALLAFEEHRPGIEPQRVDQLLGAPLAPLGSPLRPALSVVACAAIAALSTWLAADTGHAPMEAVLTLFGS